MHTLCHAQVETLIALAWSQECGIEGLKNLREAQFVKHCRPRAAR
jgi:hypothetical protein